jgi:hypothetical protein
MNVEYFNYLGSMIIDATCTCKIKSRTAVEKAAFNKKRILFTCVLDLNVRKKLGNCCSRSIKYGAETDT